jgi:hypothetical protein
MQVENYDNLFKEIICNFKYNIVTKEKYTGIEEDIPLMNC